MALRSSRPARVITARMSTPSEQIRLPAVLTAIPPQLPIGTETELWFQDEAGSGRRTRCPAAGLGAARGPAHRTTSAPNDQRTKRAVRPAHSDQWRSGPTFGAICPNKGKGAGLVMPHADTEAMTAHLAEISATVDPGARAAVMLDSHARPDGMADVEEPRGS